MEIHRDGAATLGSRHKKKLTAKTSWYKSSRKKNDEKPERRDTGRAGVARTKGRRAGDNKPTTAVIFVPRTPRGELATLLREAETELQKFCKSKVKIVEETGDTAKSLIHKANPWAGEK